MFCDFLEKRKCCKVDGVDGNVSGGNNTGNESPLQKKKSNRERLRRTRRILDMVKEENTPSGMYFCDKTGEFKPKQGNIRHNITRIQTERQKNTLSQPDRKGRKINLTQFEKKVKKRKKENSLILRAKSKNQLPCIEEVSE